LSEGRRYRIEGVLGQGGFGTVYKAQLLGEGGFTRQVALKVLNADMVGVEDVARRLRDEARLLGLLRHRAILHVDGLVRMKGRWTVVMEFIDGCDLQKVARGGGVPLGPALEIVGEVASALHVAYTTPSPSGVPLALLHRDIKPPNILITSAGEVKVLDFGIARAEFGGREAKTRSVMYGSVGYMAPERLDFEELPEGDVYALGTVLYEILTGDPFGKASIRTERHQAKVDEAILLVERKFGPMPPDFPELLGSMLAYDPEDRPSAREVERRCRSIRQAVHGPWLRDWAEHAVPPLLAMQPALELDGFSGSIIAESGGVALLDDTDLPPGDDDEPRVSATMPIEAGAEPEADSPDPTPADPASRPEPPPRTLPRSLPQRRRSSGGTALTIFGVFGCLSLLAVGGLGLLLFVGVVATLPADSGATNVGYGDDKDTGGSAIVGQDPSQDPAPTAEALPAGALAAYGPPNGPHVRAALRKPWSELDLPIGRGVPSYNDDTTLIVMYGGGDIAPLGKLWRRALEGELGYVTDYDFASDDMMSVSMTKGKEQLVMAVSTSMNNIVVSISIVQ
jgi:serine/threonine-protein kinase